MIRVSGAVHKKPKIYRPGGGLRPLSSSLATGVELLAALISFAAGAAGARQLVEHTVPLLPLVGLPEPTHILVRYEAACAIAAGVLVSVAAWLFLSGRRRAERRHLGDSDPGQSSARRPDTGRQE